MQVRARILGVPGVVAGEQKLELYEGTLAEAKKHLVEIYPDVLSLDKIFLAFVNGKAVGRKWDSVVLNDGDAVMLVVPISGG